MVAIDAVYHTKCLVTFYNRARRMYSTENADDQSASQLVNYMPSLLQKLCPT